MISEVTSDAEVESCFSVLSELRGNINKNDYLEAVRRMYQDGYRLVRYCENSETVAVAGYRCCTNFIMGRNLYIDDFVTSNLYRNMGIGSKLLNWLLVKAKEADCKSVLLDSGLLRHSAHKFYQRNGFEIIAYHFCSKV